MFGFDFRKLLVVMILAFPCMALGMEKTVEGYDYTQGVGEGEVNYKIKKDGQKEPENNKIIFSEKLKNTTDNSKGCQHFKTIGTNDKYFSELSNDEQIGHIKNILNEKKRVVINLAAEEKKTVQLNGSLSAHNKREALELVGCALIIAGFADHIWGKQVVKKLSRKLSCLFVSRNSVVQHVCSCKKNVQAGLRTLGK